MVSESMMDTTGPVEKQEQYDCCDQAGVSCCPMRFKADDAVE